MAALQDGARSRDLESAPQRRAVRVEFVVDENRERFGDCVGERRKISTVDDRQQRAAEQLGKVVDYILRDRVVKRRHETLVVEFDGGGVLLAARFGPPEIVVQNSVDQLAQRERIALTGRGKLRLVRARDRPHQQQRTGRNPHPYPHARDSHHDVS